MARREYQSGQPTTLLNPLAIGGLTFTLDLAAEFLPAWPDGQEGYPFWVTIDGGTPQEERVLCASRSDAVVTVATGGRGADGTTESAHSAGAVIWPSWSATDADEANAHINATTNVHGFTASAAEVNILDGATLSTTELNYVDGVTSPIQTQINTNTPVGTIVMYGGTTAPATGGWLLCNGQSTTGYPALAAVVGANVPDLMGRVPVGYGAGSGLTNRSTIGEKFGAETVTLTAAQSGSPAHTHPASASTTLTDAGAQTASGSASVSVADHGHSLIMWFSGTASHDHAIAGASNPYPSMQSDGGGGTIGNYNGTAVNGGGGHTANGSASVSVSNHNHTATTSVTVNNSTGANAAEAHTNIQPSTVVNFIIKT